MDRKEQRRDGAKSNPERTPGSSHHLFVTATAAVFILAGVGLGLLGIWVAMTFGWGGAYIPSWLFIGGALVFFVIGISMLASTNSRKEQS